MHTALGRAHVVGEGDDVLLIAVVVLQGDLGLFVVAPAGDVDHVVVQVVLALVQPGDVLPDAALVAHGVRAVLLRLVLALRALVGDRDVDAGVQEGLLTHPGVQGLVVVDQLVEHLRVGLEAHDGAGAVRGADDLHVLRLVAAGEFHLVDLSVLMDLDLEPLAEGVDDARADAVQAAGDLVAPAAELAARVQHGEDDLERAFAGLLLNAAAVVVDPDAVAGLDGDVDVLAVARQRLVDRVVHDLIHQMVQTAGAGGADVHARPLAHGLQALEDLDLRGVVFLCDLFRHSVYSVLLVTCYFSIRFRGSRCASSAWRR